MANVNVQFTNNQVSVSPLQTKMQGPGAITFHPAPGATWSITSVNGLPADWQQGANGNVYVVQDPHTGPNQNYTYTVTITDAQGNTHTGPSGATATDPPMIMNA